jgi:predicted ArsR family transcriptional regulator
MPPTRSDQVLSVIRRLGAASAADLAAYHPLGMDAQGARNHLRRLQSVGYVRLISDTRPRQFTPTDAGLLFLENKLAAETRP